MQKKGVSEVITVILLVMISITVIVLLWSFIFMWFNKSTESTTESWDYFLSSLSLNLKILKNENTFFDYIQKVASVQIKRGMDNLNLSEINFAFSTSAGVYYFTTQDIVSSGGTKTYYFDFRSHGLPGPDSVSLIARMIIEGKEKAMETDSLKLNYREVFTDEQVRILNYTPIDPTLGKQPEIYCPECRRTVCSINESLYNCYKYSGFKSEVGQFCQNNNCNYFEKWCEGADINKDGKVNDADRIMLGERIIGRQGTMVCDADNNWCDGADITHDSILDSFDASIVQGYLACTEKNLWCEGADIDKSGKVDGTEVSLVGGPWYGESKIEICRERVEHTCCSQNNSWCNNEDLNHDGVVDCSTYNNWCDNTDINKDGIVNFGDLAIVVNDDNWNRDDCSASNNWCEGADVNRDGFVNKTDRDLVESRQKEDGEKITFCGQVFSSTYVCCSSDNSWCNNEDLNHDGVIDCSIHNNWCSNTDVNKDGVVNNTDVNIIIKHMCTYVAEACINKNMEYTGCDKPETIEIACSPPVRCYGTNKSECESKKGCKWVSVNYNEVDIYPNEILLIANQEFPDRDGNGISDSVDVALYYAQQRNIPLSNILYLSSSTTGVSRDELNSEDVPQNSEQKIINTIKNHIESNNLKNKIYYIVTFYGVPLAYPDERAYPNREPLDKAISQIFFPTFPQYPNYQPENRTEMDMYSFKIKEQDRRNYAEPYYEVSRIDAPTLEIAKGLIDKAIYAEKYIDLRTGKGYFDWCSVGGALDGYFEAEGAVKNFGAQTISINQTYVINPWTDCDPYGTRPNKNFEKGDCPDTMFYYGGYRHWRDPLFDFKPGATACELHSYSALLLRAKRYHVPMMLHEGVTATVGFVDEPYLNDPFYNFYNAFLKGFNFIDSAYKTSVVGDPTFSFTYKKFVRIGDPLYNPTKYIKTQDKEKPKLSEIKANLTEYGMEFTWKTDEIATSFIEYGTTKSYGNTLQDIFYRLNAQETGKTYKPKFYTKNHGIDPFHKFVLDSSLQPATTYHYRIHSIDPLGNEFVSADMTFTTPASLEIHKKMWDPVLAIWGYPNKNLWFSQGGYSTYWTYSFFKNFTIRNFIKENKHYQSGNYIRVKFKASSSGRLEIVNAKIGEASSYGYYKNNISTQNWNNLTFNGINSIVIPAGQEIWSDWVTLNVKKGKAYLISFYTGNTQAISGYEGQTLTGGRTFDSCAYYRRGDYSEKFDWNEEGLPLIWSTSLGIEEVQVKD